MKTEYIFEKLIKCYRKWKSYKLLKKDHTTNINTKGVALIIYKKGKNILNVYKIFHSVCVLETIPKYFQCGFRSIRTSTADQTTDTRKETCSRLIQTCYIQICLLLEMCLREESFSYDLRNCVQKK